MPVRPGHIADVDGFLRDRLLPAADVRKSIGHRNDRFCRIFRRPIGPEGIGQIRNQPSPANRHPARPTRDWKVARLRMKLTCETQSSVAKSIKPVDAFYRDKQALSMTREQATPKDSEYQAV